MQHDVSSTPAADDTWFAYFCYGCRRHIVGERCDHEQDLKRIRELELELYRERYDHEQDLKTIREIEIARDVYRGNQANGRDT